MAGNPWGYHRLAEPWPARLIAAAGVRPRELVLDIGAGDGALTAALLRRLLDRRNTLYAADLVLPRAVVSQRVQRGAAGWQLRRGPAVPSAAFRPRAAKDCAVLVVRRAR